VFPRLRAHVPLSPSRPPRFIFVGVTRSFARGRSETLASVPKRANERIGVVLAIDFWASLPSAVRLRRRPLTLNSSTRFRRADPALGLVLFQGCRARFSRATARGLVISESSDADHQPPASLRRTHNLATGQPIRSWALRTPPPQSSSRRRNVRRPRSSARPGPLAARAFVLPFSVFEGLMPGHPSRGLRTRVGHLPV